MPKLWVRPSTKKNAQADKLSPNWEQEWPETFLTEDYCAIEDRDFFVRGIIELPIIGTAEALRWGIWCR
jgi:hypothetical protein